jgi:hypothetical protein
MESCDINKRLLSDYKNSKLEKMKQKGNKKKKFFIHGVGIRYFNNSNFKESRSNFVVWTETVSALIIGVFISWFIVFNSGFGLWICKTFELLFIK